MSLSSWLPAEQSLFLVWGPPSHGPRSQVLAQALHIPELHFVSATSRRGAWVAPFKYGVQALKTLRLLFHKRPKIVFVQSPPGLAVLVVYLYTALTGGRYLVDAHSAALLLPYWTRPRWLYRLLAQKALTTMVTNEHFQQMIAEWGGHALVLRDIPANFPPAAPLALNGKFHITVVNTFSPDEPLEQVLEAAAGLGDVQFHVTGRPRNGQPMPPAPANVHFTGFLPTEQYYALLRGSHAVMCLTTRNHTMQRGACEALSLGKPIITSDWPLLRDYFHRGTVHVDNSSEGIRQGVGMLQENYEQYAAGIQALQAFQQREWQEKVAALAELLQQAI